MAEKTGVRYRIRGSQVIPTEVEEAGRQSSIDIDNLTASTEYEIVAYYDAGDGNEITSQTNYFKSATVAKYITLTNEYAGDNTLRITKHGTPTSTGLSYSTDDGETWTNISAGGSVTIRENEKILMKSSDGLSTGSNDYFNFSMSEAYSVSGHIASLWGYKYANMTTLPANGCRSMFESSDKLLEANIDFTGITYIGDYACNNMFYGCSSLTTVPKLSSITNIGNSALYQMFMRCTSLTTPPNLSGITSIQIGGFYQMFYGCSSLISAPSLARVTYIRSSGCNGMFAYCGSLTAAPDMSSVKTIETNGCTEMFMSCISLTTAPDLSRLTTIGNDGCSEMYYNCTSLTTGQDLSSVTTIGNVCFRRTYYNCINLSRAYTPNIDTWDSNKFTYWLYNAGTQATGTKTVYKPAALSVPIDSDSGVPTGWTTDDYA